MDALPDHFCMIYVAVGFVLYLLGYEHGHLDRQIKRDGEQAGDRSKDARR